jgi:hypothetical protein
MLNIEINDSIVKKLNDKHNVTTSEVRECFDNVTNGFLIDSREEHITDPPSHFFIAKTNKGRRLKIIFMYFEFKKKFIIKSAFEADQKAIGFYEKMTRK